ncbi:prepilin-type N-terminal cleavage/methylation domain-containing protein [Candidatus Gracilibacteria bacterium]|nr:prepilin-type N-terminal cleavage/methylation domain-containing protein [Candidatus Gracilibacteria bacterium]
MNKRAFTFVELIIVTAIIGILTVIGFVSYVDFVSSARDTQRISDLEKVSSALKISKQSRGVYPDPGDNFSITNNGYTVAYQGFLNNNVRIPSLESLPKDPKESDINYVYSITGNKQEFQLATTLENDDTPIAHLTGNYSSVSKNVLPTLFLAMISTTPIEIHDGVGDGSVNRNLFIFHRSSNNLPYLFDTQVPYSEGLTFDELITIAENGDHFWQNNDYRSCIEIYEDKKYISDFSNTGTTEQYQILSSTGALVNTDCNTQTDSFNGI